jgi:phage terminase large subunit GpA-like protein
MPPPPQTALDWVESDNGPYLSERTSGIAGKLRLDITPYLRFPLEQFSSPSIERMALCFGTQSGKTTFLQCIIGYIIDCDPGPTMFLRPTHNEAEDFSRDRMMPFVMDCPSTARHIVGRYEDHIRPMEYRFDRMTLRYAWSQSEVSVRGHPIRYLIKDESSAYAPGASALADERTKTFWNRKIVETSTPSQDTDTIWQFLGLRRRAGLKPEDVFISSSYDAESATSVYFYELPCPRCGKFIRLEASQLRWPKDMALRDIESHGWYECQKCRKKITDADKLGAMQNAQWKSDNPGGRWIGFHLNSLYAPWASCRFGAVAYEMVKARWSGDYEVLKSFVNNWLALPYSLEDLGADVITLTSVERSKATRYLKNEIPACVRALSFGADVQGDRLYWVILGWNTIKEDNGTLRIECWVISWGESADFDSFSRDVVTKDWLHQTGARMRCICGAMDGRFRSGEVKDFAKAYPVCSVVYGEQTIKTTTSTAALPFRATYIDRDSKGKALPTSRVGYRINTVYWKQWLYQRMNKIGDHIVQHLPSDSTPDAKLYIRHLSSEVEVQERARGSTAIRRVWKVRKGYDQNHWLDATVYGSAIASIKGVFGMTPEGTILGEVKESETKSDAPTVKKRPSFFERRPIR